jgi:DNA-directed RNA polymerase subunit beta'
VPGAAGEPRTPSELRHQRGARHVIDINNFDSIRIGLASSRQIRQWSSGEVTKPETINYRTLKPEKDGLFCEKIFGPTKDWECYCGKYKRVRYKGIICERCGVEVTRAKVRRERMGHIDLAAPVSHIWFFKGVPSRIGYILDIAPKELEKVLYFAGSIVTRVDTVKRAEDLPELEDKVREAAEQYRLDQEERKVELEERLERRLRWLRENDTTDFDDEDVFWVEELERDRSPEGPVKRELTDADRKQAETEIRRETDAAIRDGDRYTEEAIERLTQAWELFKALTPRQIISDEQLFREMKDRFGSPYGFGEYFEGGMGASAIRELLEDLSRPSELEDAEPGQTKLQDEAARLRETITTSKGQKQARALKRLRVVSAFIRSENRPEWMILEAVPVIPPELRPMVQLDGGRFATSDLNDLYRRVINRNNRLKRLLDLGAPEIIVNNEKRMLQEAVDALFDNGRRGRAVTGPGNRPLKSLSDMLKGKQGRFRQNLLGKRVDYSGRSVIVAGPDLRLHQCGLPKLMALELFKPFIMSRLVERNQVQNIKAAKKLVDSMVPEVWDVLEEVIAEHPVLLNRAPTLHRLGIQAFEPVLVEGKAIQIHPLVCTAFNADFDGDQMAVHLPLSVEAQAEARILMLSANNILSPAHGRPITVPSQDMVLGLYYLTYCQTLDVREGKDAKPRLVELTELYDPEARRWALPKGAEASLEGSDTWTKDPFAELGLGRPKHFNSVQAVLSAIDHGAVDLQEIVVLRERHGENVETTVTTPGRIVFNHELELRLRQVVAAEVFVETPFPRQARVFTKRDLSDFIETLVDLYGATAVSMVLDTFKSLGFTYASTSGLTISKNDIVVPPNKEDIIRRYEGMVEEVEEDFGYGLMTGEERHEKVIDLWERATNDVGKAMEEHLFRLNPIYMMANSGARGSFKQIRQLAGMRGCMNNPKGETIERPIKSNFMEGLSVLEYFISTHGARKGLADTALKTADSGYLTRRLVDVSQDVIIRDRDCGTHDGIEIPVFRDGDLNPNLAGRVLAGPVIDRATGEVLADLRGPAPDEDDHEATLAHLGRTIENTEAAELAATLRDEDGRPRDAVAVVRSPLKCRSDHGLCVHCYGRSLASGELCDPGDAVGIIAAQSIGEPGTQLTMRTFHTGGVAGADITHGLPRVVELFESRKPKALAHVAATDGWIRIEDDEVRPGAARLVLTEVEHIETKDAGTGAKRAPVREHAYPVAKRTQITVDDGQWVEAGDLLTIGSAYPADILESTSGIFLSAAGRIASARVGKDGWVKVEVEGEEGVEVRFLRVPSEKAKTIAAALKGAEASPGEPLRILGARKDRSTKTEAYLVSEVQNVYRSQGVDINDKHIELIVRQMLKKVRIMESRGTHFLPGQLVDKPVLYRENARAAIARREELLAQRASGEFTGSDEDLDWEIDEVQARFEPLILGITKASLATESFLSAASFQETTKVLTDAALEGRVDRLRGLKENVIIGKLIPAATGLRRYRQLEIEPVRRAPALLEFDLEEPFAPAYDDEAFVLGEGDGGTYTFEPDFSDPGGALDGDE